MDNKLSNRIQIDKTQSSEIVNKIAKIDEFKGWFKAGTSLSPQIMLGLRRSTVVTSTGASTRIEGSRLSDEEVKKLLKNIKIKKLKDRDSQEVAGYAELTNLIFSNYKNVNLTENLILSFHNILMKYSEKDHYHRGKYKIGSNKVVARDENGKESVIFNPTEPYLTPIEMKNLIDWTVDELEKKAFHPLLILSNFILEFLSIHPFQDGNGRLSRALTNLMLLKYGYDYAQYASLEKIVEDNKAEYYLSLRQSQKELKTENADITPWLIFFLEALIKQTEVAKKRVEQEAVNEMLSENQLDALRLFDSHEYITNKIIVEELRINRETVKQVLKKLAELKLIKKTGSGRAAIYRKAGKKGGL